MELIKDVKAKLCTLEKKVEDLSKFRWITVGVIGAATLVIGSATFFGNILTIGKTGATVIEPAAQSR